jgi:pimeloyl-ACP methyl ester carboxylesterase
LFDLPLSDYSMQSFLAARGWRNFALDVRGYGRSLPSKTLDAPPDANVPYARLADAVDDLTSGVEFVLQKTGSDKVNIISFSWGSVVSCVYAEDNSHLVERLVLYAPLYAEVNESWIDRIADPNDRTRVNPTLGSYRWVRQSDFLSRWDADIPDGAEVKDYRDEEVSTAILRSLAKADPASNGGRELSFRAPSGALVDLFEIFGGRPLFNPQRITAKTLVIRGSDDTTSTDTDALKLFHMLGTLRKRFITISPGSHFLCVERNAQDLFREIDLFLGGDPA